MRDILNRRHRDAKSKWMEERGHANRKIRNKKVRMDIYHIEHISRQNVLPETKSAFLMD